MYFWEENSDLFRKVIFGGRKCHSLGVEVVFWGNRCHNFKEKCGIFRERRPFFSHIKCHKCHFGDKLIFMVENVIFQ